MAAGSLSSTVSIVEMASRLHQHLATLVRLHALGYRRVFVSFMIAASGGIQPSPFDLPEGESRNHRRLLHRILRLSSRSTPPANVSACSLPAVSAITLFLDGWAMLSFSIPHMDSVLRLVFS